jgi:hypothetical protein
MVLPLLNGLKIKKNRFIRYKMEESNKIIDETDQISKNFQVI